MVIALDKIRHFSQKPNRGTVFFEEMIAIVDALGSNYEQTFISPNGTAIKRGDKMEKICGILFSGGLDSSLAVCKMIEKGYRTELLHFDQGALISNNLVSIRYNELKKVYSDCIKGITSFNVSGLFRRIALVSLEEDIKKYNVSLVCVGCKLAMHIQSIIFCEKNKIQYMADGSTERQKRYGEQREVTIDFLKGLYSEHGITYENPVYDLEKKEIKYGLFDRGMTIQPLEDTCLFSNTFSIASDEVIEQYLKDKKQLCNELIERGMLYEKNR